MSQHLENEHISAQLYGIRWSRLLLGREFSAANYDIFLIWDYIFACCYEAENFYLDRDIAGRIGQGNSSSSSGDRGRDGSRKYNGNGSSISSASDYLEDDTLPNIYSVYASVLVQKHNQHSNQQRRKISSFGIITNGNTTNTTTTTNNNNSNQNSTSTSFPTTSIVGSTVQSNGIAIPAYVCTPLLGALADVMLGMLINVSINSSIIDDDDDDDDIVNNSIDGDVGC